MRATPPPLTLGGSGKTVRPTRHGRSPYATWALSDSRSWVPPARGAGSKYLIEGHGARVPVDRGLFRGLKPLRERNWASLPVDPASIDAVVLTHAHLDHSG